MWNNLGLEYLRKRVKSNYEMFDFEVRKQRQKHVTCINCFCFFCARIWTLLGRRDRYSDSSAYVVMISLLCRAALIQLQMFKSTPFLRAASQIQSKEATNCNFLASSDFLIFDARFWRAFVFGFFFLQWCLCNGCFMSNWPLICLSTMGQKDYGKFFGLFFVFDK